MGKHIDRFVRQLWGGSWCKYSKSTNSMLLVLWSEARSLSKRCILNYCKYNHWGSWCRSCFKDHSGIPTGTTNLSTCRRCHCTTMYWDSMALCRYTFPYAQCRVLNRNNRQQEPLYLLNCRSSSIRSSSRSNSEGSHCRYPWIRSRQSDSSSNCKRI